MKRALTVAVLLAAGCGWSNPYDTSDLEYELAVRDENVILLTRAAAWPADAPEPLALGNLRPNLDAWRASDVEKAEPTMLLDMRAKSRARIVQNQRWVRYLETIPDRVVHNELRAAREEVALEMAKLSFIEAEISRRAQ